MKDLINLFKFKIGLQTCPDCVCILKVEGLEFNIFFTSGVRPLRSISQCSLNKNELFTSDFISKSLQIDGLDQK